MTTGLALGRKPFRQGAVDCAFECAKRVPTRVKAGAFGGTWGKCESMANLWLIRNIR